MGKLIDADACLNEAWQNFYKQEDEDRKNIDGYDIMRDEFYEQRGFECCQQTIVNAKPIEAILKADYEKQLKADLAAMILEIQTEIEELNTYDVERTHGLIENAYISEEVDNIIQQKIDKLKGE